MANMSYANMSVDPNAISSMPQVQSQPWVNYTPAFIQSPANANMTQAGTGQPVYSPPKSGQVLGASDSANNGGGAPQIDTGAEKKPNVNGWYNELGNWEWMQPAGQGNGVDMRMLDEAYGNLQNIFGQQESAARGNAATAEKSVMDRYGADVGKTQAEQDKLIRDLMTKKQQFTESALGAANQNVVDYNALEQRANVRYGGGSSLGDLMRELAAKELYKQQGQIRTQQLAGERDFGQQEQDAKLFISQKLGDLDLWKNEAIGKIQESLSGALAQINAMRGESEINKANAKIAALQKAQDDARQITAADVQFRTGLMSAYIQNAQETMGRAFTPEEISNLVAQFNSPVFSPYQQAYSNMAYNPGALSKDDEEQKRINELMLQQQA